MPLRFIQLAVFKTKYSVQDKYENYVHLFLGDLLVQMMQGHRMYIINWHDLAEKLQKEVQDCENNWVRIIMAAGKRRMDGLRLEIGVKESFKKKLV